MIAPTRNPQISRIWKQTCGVPDRALNPFVDVERACAAWLNRKEAEGTIDPSARSKRIVAQIHRDRKFATKSPTAQ